MQKATLQALYVPPHKLVAANNSVGRSDDEAYQRLAWEALKKSINGLINKVNSSNIGNVIPELFAEDLIRGAGLLCRSCLRSQMASPCFTDVFAAVIAVVNSRIPEIGELLLKRIVWQLNKSLRCNDKPRLLALAKFVAHLVNQRVAHHTLALELLHRLLENPSDDGVELAVAFLTECGALLHDLSPRGLAACFDRLRDVLHEGEIDKRVQFLIEGLFAIRKANFRGYPAIRPELDLLEDDQQITHDVSLDDSGVDPELGRNVFKFDPDYALHESQFEAKKKSILGDQDEEEEEEETSTGSESESDESEEEDDLEIKDKTETEAVELRRTIYLTIMNSLRFEELGHKLLSLNIAPGQELEICRMLVEACAQEKTYNRIYGLVAQRLSMIRLAYRANFERCFAEQYSTSHRLETNKLRNVATLFAHLIATDALPWDVLGYVRLTEEDTNSSSRIFVKYLFQEMTEQLGIRKLNERLTENAAVLGDSIFPKDSTRNARFSINFFTQIGLGGLTEGMREHLKEMERVAKEDREKKLGGSDSESEVEESSSDDEGRDRKRRRRKSDGRDRKRSRRG
ncbi:unnamed protein product [Linum tenue]|uniref:MI domain-containing protein n=1 Tax=Linum tenue TaxID=586396 RepID=A0AAV0QCR1_9ROSI|nr:unnamed protein product [Linum tenue]